MNNLDTTINLDSKIQGVFSGYTIYKKEYTSPQSFGFNGGLFDGQYIITLGTLPKLGILYKINFNAINLLFYRYLNKSDVRYGANKTVGFFDTETLMTVLNQAKQDVEQFENEN